MKWGVSLSCAVRLLCLVLVSLPAGWTRPATSEAKHHPPLNCTNVPNWPSEEHRSQNTNSKLPDDSSAKTRAAHSVTINPRSLSDHHQQLLNSTYQITTAFFDSDQSPEYFDYYYEESGEVDFGLDDSYGGEEVKKSHQPPPGLNRVAKLKLIKTPRRQPPEYMLELYDRFSKIKAAVTTQGPRHSQEEEKEEEQEDPSDLGADIVRSFPNINKEDSDDDVIGSAENDVVMPASAASEDDDDDHQQQLAGRDTRHHTLVFNITSLLTGEEVSRAELRLYTLVEQDRNTYMGEDRMVRVYEGLQNHHHHHHLPPVASRPVLGHRSGAWETFDLTSVVRAWVRKGSRRSTGEEDGVHVLDVKIDSLSERRRGSAGKKGGPGGTSVDFDVDPEHNEGPLLVVFSKDTTWHLQQELQDFINHEPSDDPDDHDDDDEQEEEDSSPLVSSASTGKDDQSVDSGEPSSASSGKYDQIVDQSGEASSAARTARSAVRDPPQPFWHTTTTTTVSGWKDIPEGKTPLRRVRRDKRKRNSCRRRAMYVDFQDINWHQWIIAPPGYMAFECVGKCYVPIGAHLSPTKHAIIQTLVHAAHPKRASRACCVPTKLEPISILYLDENNIITYKYHYDDMVVAECGCR